MTVNLEAELDKLSGTVTELGRVALITSAENTRLQLEVEQLRNACHILLNAIPEGFKTPLLYPQAAARVKEMLKKE